MGRLINAALWLYPRAVRRGHGAEMESLVTDLIEQDGRSRHAVIGRLALDGLIQRATSRATAWALAASLTLVSVGSLAVSDFSAASAHASVPAHHHLRHHHARAQNASVRQAGIIGR